MTRPTDPRTQKAVIYCRLSQLKDESHGLERQEKDGLAYAAQHGYEVLQVFKEAQSAYAMRERPLLSEALKLIQAGEAQHLVVYKLDRLTRGGISGLVKILDVLEESGAHLHSVTESIDASTSTGRIIISVLSELARSEAENTSIRWKRLHQERASNGMKHSRSFGFTPAGEHIPEEVALIREAAEHVLGGGSMRSLAIKWNEQNIPSVRGKEWESQTLSRMLKAPSLRGVRLNGSIELPGSFEPIFSPEEHALIISSIRTKSKSAQSQSLLGGLGLVICGNCNYPLHAAPGPPGRSPRYICPTTGHGRTGPGPCSKVGVVRSLVDDKVTSKFFEIVNTWKHDFDLPTVDLLQQQLDNDEQALKELTEARYILRVLTDEAYLPVHDVLLERITEARNQIKARGNQPVKKDLPTPGDAEGWWGEASLEEKRRAIRTVIKQVTVQRTGKMGNKPDPDRVQVETDTKFLWEKVAEFQLSEE